MRSDNVIAYFGGVAETAKAMGVKTNTVYGWAQKDLVPPAAAIRAYCRSGGDLNLDPWMYDDWPMSGRVSNKQADRRLWFVKKREEDNAESDS